MKEVGKSHFSFFHFGKQLDCNEHSGFVCIHLFGGWGKRGVIYFFFFIIFNCTIEARLRLLKSSSK